MSTRTTETGRRVRTKPHPWAGMPEARKTLRQIARETRKRERIAASFQRMFGRAA